MEQENMEIEDEIDLLDLFLELLKHWVVIGLFTVAGGIIAAMISLFLLTPMYSSTSKMYIMSSSSGVVDLSSLQISSNLASDYQELIKSRPVVEQVISDLGLDMEYEDMLGYISVQNIDDTRIISITATYSDPVMAKDIANDFTEVSKTRISNIMMVEEPTTVEEAVVADQKSSPSNTKNTIIGAAVGFILSVGFFTVLYLLNDTVKNADDIEKYLGLSMLAAIPDEGGTDNSEKKDKKKNRIHGIRKV